MKKKFPLWPFILIGVIMICFMWICFAGRMGGNWMAGPMGYGAGFHGGWIIFPVICLILMMFCMKRKGGGICGMKNHDSQEDVISILKNRYAKGEITKQEFEEMKREIQKD